MDDVLNLNKISLGMDNTYPKALVNLKITVLYLVTHFFLDTTALYSYLYYHKILCDFNYEPVCSIHFLDLFKLLIYS